VLPISAAAWFRAKVRDAAWVPSESAYSATVIYT
jgi:hypothetical protein